MPLDPTQEDCRKYQDQEECASVNEEVGYNLCEWASIGTGDEEPVDNFMCVCPLFVCDRMYIP